MNETKKKRRPKNKAQIWKQFDLENEQEINTTIQTTLEPKLLELSIQDNKLQFKNDVAIIEVRAIDKNGNLAKLASNEITCKITGGGELIGIENASNNVAENYTDNKHRLLNGKAKLYIRLTNNNQEMVKIEVSSRL